MRFLSKVLAAIGGKSRWLIVPPKGHEDLPRKMMILRHNSVFIIDQKNNVASPSNTHDFSTRKEAQDWLENTIEQLEKAQYKVI